MRDEHYHVERIALMSGTLPVSMLLLRYLLRSAECSERERRLSTSTQEDKQQERRRKQAKRVCHSQVGERSQTSQLGRDGARQLVVGELPVDVHKAQRARNQSTSTQKDKQQERRRKQAKRFCHSQGDERSQTSQLGRDGANQLVVGELPVDFHKAQRQLSNSFDLQVRH